MLQYSIDRLMSRRLRGAFKRARLRILTGRAKIMSKNVKSKMKEYSMSKERVRLTELTSAGG